MRLSGWMHSNPAIANTFPKRLELKISRSSYSTHSTALLSQKSKNALKPSIWTSLRFNHTVTSQLVATLTTCSSMGILPIPTPQLLGITSTEMALPSESWEVINLCRNEGWHNSSLCDQWPSTSTSAQWKWKRRFESCGSQFESPLFPLRNYQTPNGKCSLSRI